MAGDNLGTILVVGAGQGTELAALRRLGAKRLVLVEANPRWAEALAQRTDPGRGEQVLSLAVVPGEMTRALLHVVSQPQHSSLRTPTGLLALFPNLHAVEDVEVEARPFADLVRDLALVPGARHLLVIDAPGQAATLLRSLPASVLQDFEWILVRTEAEPLYEGDESVAEVLTALGGAGFTAPTEDPDAIYPHQSVLVTRDAAMCHQLALSTRLQAADLRIRELVDQSARKDEEIARLGQALALRLSELQAQSGLVQERDARLQSQLEEHAAQRQSLVQERDGQARLAAEWKIRGEGLEARIETMTRQLEEAGARLEAQARLSEDAQAQMHDLAGQRDERARQVAEGEARVQALMAERDEQARQLEAAAARFEAQVAEQARQAEAATARFDAQAAELEAVTKLAKERHSAIQVVTRERDEQVALVESMRAALESERQQFAARLAASKMEQDPINARVAALTENTARLERELADGRQALALSIRMQTLRETDLGDLQQRYQEIQRRSEDQRQLLSKLAERLKAASAYFHQITAPHDVERPQVLVDARVRPGRRLPGKSDKTATVVTADPAPPVRRRATRSKKPGKRS